ncbi:cytidylate kinase-like family protein [Oscillochloris sp. ZM17-4]|uniref:cytidylate kinase-like family protein n=1 Tax=Oscillochloris sp. ZM17-4 TaxID=2866714 RepID=UPI001C736960|nr:cytidylate kinase-like family protein [Oscillochloris sp. ZM17-4]MBX0329617.1 cytidylate kinase-like family protein [Oscillochloris sp. ZM17-4]
MTVITISHELGSGGRAIGEAVARELCLSYIDRQIVQQVAERLHMREEVVALRDEHADGPVDQILRAFADGPALFLGAPPLDPDLRIDELTCHQATLAVIAAAARSNLALIAGHGANFALSDYLGVMNVFIYAPTARRAATIAARDGLSLDEATYQVARSDQSRDSYVRRRYHAHWQDPAHYHLMLNTAALSENHCAEIIAAAWRRGGFGPFRPHRAR